VPPERDGDADPRQELRALVGQLRTNLAARGRSGLVGVVVDKGPSRRAAAAPSPAGAAPSSPVASAAPPSPVASAAPPVSEPAFEVAADAPANAKTGRQGLAVVRDDLGDCQRCKLALGRKNLVFGVGNPDAELVFVGEAPGADEDLQGEPFVGKAGQLLTKMIEAMGYRREDVYICNVLKCRPPGNRNPEPDEVASCEPFLKRQLAAIRPRMIVALGKFAAQCLLRDDTPITRLRGGFRSYEGIPLMPTLHPAYLLRDPSKKKLAWEDLKAVNAALARVGIHPPRPPAA
jgi:DNA polymerase